MSLVSHRDLGRVRKEAEWSLAVSDTLHAITERHLIALEEVLAARWPRRWVLAARHRRALRRSVRHLDGSFADRREQAISLEAHIYRDGMRNFPRYPG